jgi:hypothetical protein
MSEQFEIYSGAQFAPLKRNGLTPRTSKYPFAQMDVGDFIIVPGKNSKNFGATVRAASLRNNMKFSLRTGPVYDTDGNEIAPAGSCVVLRVEGAPKQKKAA